MKNNIFKLINMVLVGTLLATTTPAVLAKGITSKKTSQNKQPPTATTTNSVPTVQDLSLTPEQIAAILTQYLTPEQIQKLIKFIQGIPYKLDEDTFIALKQAMQNFVSGMPYALTQEQFDQLMSALKTLVQNVDWDQFIATIQKMIDKAAQVIDSHSLANSQESRDKAKQAMIALHVAILEYDKMLSEGALPPAAQITGDTRAEAFKDLREVYNTYYASYQTLLKLDTTDPISSETLTNTFHAMFFNAGQTSYFQTRARSVFGAIQTLLVQPYLNYTLDGLKLAAGSLKKGIDFVSGQGYPTDAVSAQLMGINYLIGEQNGNGGLTQQRITDAVNVANNVLLNDTNQYPMFFVGYAVNDMVAAAKMMQIALHIDPEMQTRLGPGR